MTATIHAGDAIKWAWQYEGPRFHALLCDPPYHLTNRVVDWSAFSNPEEGGCGKPVLTRNSEKGFMGKTWDGGDVAFQPSTWEAFYHIMLPGAFGMAFASARGWHRLACAIEDAGFVIHPSLFGWAYGSGFPKATRIDTQIDKAAGAEREVVDDKYKSNHPNPDIDGYSGNMHSGKHTAPSTPLAQSWAGHRYGLQALKPALEPIICFQRPYEGRPLDCITETGAGALWIEGGRIGTDEIVTSSTNLLQFSGQNTRPYQVGRETEYSQHQGRWPANFLLLDDEAAQALDAQSGDKPSRWGKASGGNAIYGSEIETSAENCYFDSGGASRFFFRVSDQLDEADPVRYCAKASRSERDAGLEGEPIGESGAPMNSRCANCGRLKLDHEQSKCPKHEPMERVSKGSHNPHPTVKPLTLTRYLATLLLPPAEYAPRRLFVPFAGVASEMIGAHQAGWDIIEGVELEAESADIGRKRIEYWLSKPVQVELNI